MERHNVQEWVQAEIEGRFKSAGFKMMGRIFATSDATAIPKLAREWNANRETRAFTSNALFHYATLNLPCCPSGESTNSLFALDLRPTPPGKTDDRG